MIPVEQTVFHDPPESHGNCFRACVASIMEVRIDYVPPFEKIMFEADDEDWFVRFREWLHSEGWGLWYWLEVGRSLPIENRGELLVLTTGPSPRFQDTGHCILTRNRQLVHDPHPSGAGIDGKPYDHMVLLDPKNET